MIPARKEFIYQVLAKAISMLPEESLGKLVAFASAMEGEERFGAFWVEFRPYLVPYFPQLGAPAPVPQPPPPEPDPEPEPPIVVPPSPTPNPSPGRFPQFALYYNEGGPGSSFGHAGAAVAIRAGMAAPHDVVKVYQYDPNATQKVGVDWFAREAQKAKAAGYVAWVSDIEIDWMIYQGHEFCRRVADTIRAALPFGWAPKASLDHFHSYKGTPTWGWTAEQVVPWFEQTSDFLVPWQYAWQAETWLNRLDGYRQLGYRGMIIPLCEPQRNWDGNKPLSASSAAMIHSAGYPIGFFAPTTHQGKPVSYAAFEKYAAPTVRHLFTDPPRFHR